jgi:SAM-dependent methyltransferase
MPAPADRLAGLIHDLARARAAVSPPPRALPYLALEHASGTSLHLLDALSTRGIFRKYELVLDLGAGLAGTSRWLAMRLGCNVVGTAAEVDVAIAGTFLTRRARLAAQVHLVPGDPGALPFRTARFTHAWILETLPRMPDAPAALREACRLVRPGGTVAVQDLVLRDATGPDVPGWSFASLAARVDQLRDAGFVDVTVRDRTAEAPERPAQIVTAEDELLRRLRADPLLAPFARERDSLARARADGALAVVQLLAGRP